MMQRLSDKKVMASLMLFIGLLCVVMAAFPEFSFAATGDGIFKQATQGIVNQILPAHFGAMLAMIAGVIALVSAATGSYKGAWALLFVCIVCLLAKNLVGLLFSGSV